MAERVITNRRKGDKMQNVLLSGALAMLLWIIQQMFALGAGIADMQPRLAAIEIQAAAAYRAADAKRDYGDLDTRIKRLERGRWHDGGSK